jgi:MFS family permease
LAAAATVSFHDTWRPRANPWVIAITVTLATFMEALDTSIANVAMGHIGGSLSASREEATWVLTSYLVANAVVLPISGWIANRIGRKRFYMSCVMLFTLASLLCGLAPTLGILVFFRVVQGAAGGGLQPSEQSILADTFPPQKRSMAFAVYGMAVVLAPVLGPTVGGWIVDNYSWRWIFFINIPVGLLSLYLTNRVVEDPPYLAAIRKRREGVDYWGLGLLVVAIGALQVMLDKGQEDDWFSSRFITTCAVVAAVGLVIFVIRQLNVEHPILDLRLLAQRNVGTTMFVMFMVGVSLYSSTVLIPQFLQEIMGYSAEQAGMAVSSGGIALMLLFPGGRRACAKIRSPMAGGHGLHHHNLRPVAHDRDQSQCQLWHGGELARGNRARPALSVHPHQYAVLRGHSPGEVQRGQRFLSADAQSGRQRGHQLCDHAAGPPGAEASGHAGRAYGGRQRPVRRHAFGSDRRMDAALRRGLAGRHAARRSPDLRHGANSGAAAGLCRCDLDDGGADRTADPAAVSDAPAEKERGRYLWGTEGGLSYRRQRLLQIGNQVFLVFDPH